MIPGLLMSAARWRDIGYVDAFSVSFRVLAVDPLGHGLSEKAHSAGDYLYEDCALDVLAVLDAAGVEEAHIWGYSRGSNIAAALADRAPDRVLSLALGASGFFAALQASGRVVESEQQRQRTANLAGALSAADWNTFWALMGNMDTATQEILRRGQDGQAIAAALEGGPLSRMHTTGLALAAIRRLAPLVYAGTEEPWFAAMKEGAALLGGESHAISGRGHAGAFQDLATVAPIVRAHLQAASIG